MNIILSRIANDRGDNNTISILLWIVLVLVLVTFVGKILYDAISKKSEDVAKCIEDSNNVFGGSGKCK